MVDGLYMSIEGQEVTTSHLSKEQKQKVEGILSQFAGIFKEPKGMPPKRKQEHDIRLVEGHGPVNVRPCRYSHHHKMRYKNKLRRC